VTNANNGSWIRQLGQRSVSGDIDQKIERCTSFYLKLREEMESHTTLYLGRSSTTVTVTQKEDTIGKRCRSSSWNH